MHKLDQTIPSKGTAIVDKWELIRRIAEDEAQIVAVRSGSEGVFFMFLESREEG